MVARALTISITVAVAFAAATGCEKTNDENIDKWTHTQKGPGKLRKAMADEELDVNLSAHAAANLIKMGQDPDVRNALEKMSPGRRTQLIGALAPRLWDLARVPNESDLPNSQQIAAKDALVNARKY